MERLDRNALIVIAVSLTLGLAIWQLLSSVGYVATELLTDWWEGEGTFEAEFSIGSVQVEYGQVLATLITLLIALLVAIPLFRYATRRRTPSSS
jgi:ABC-type phosphate transport system permease subunit